MGQTTFRLVYGMEVVMPMEYIILSLQIVVMTGMVDYEALEKGLCNWKNLRKNGF